FRTRTLPSISDGDTVAMAGVMKQGTLEASAMRNLTTGADHHLPTTMLIVMAAVVGVLGVPLIAILGIGLFFIGCSVWIILKALRIRKSAAALQSVSVPAAAAAV